MQDTDKICKIIPRASSERCIYTIYRFESDLSADNSSNQPDYQVKKKYLKQRKFVCSYLQVLTQSTTNPTTEREISHKFSRLTNILQSSRNEQIDSESEFHPIDDIAQQTRHAAEPTENVHDEHIDNRRIEYNLPITTFTPNLSPLQQQELGLSKITIDDRKLYLVKKINLKSFFHLFQDARQLLQAQSTRSSVECVTAESDSLPVYDTNGESPVLTNYLGHEFTGMDRSVLSVTDYSNINIRTKTVSNDLILFF